MEPTPYSEINQFLQQFLPEVQETLGRNFIGMYLYGSLAIGDFDPASSDIDILVVTTELLSRVQYDALAKLHAGIGQGGSPWAHRLEVSYAPKESIRRFDPSNNRYPLVSPVSPFGTIEHGKDWIINRYIIREHGVVVSGLSPKDIIDPVSADAIRSAARDLLCEQWSKHIDGPDWMKPRKYQAFTALTLCRMLYAIELGAVTSKPKAAAWAIQHLEARWKPLIERSLEQRANPAEGPMDETLEFLKFVLDANCPNRT